VVALREVVVRLSEIISRVSDRIETLEINPLIVAPEGHGVWAADALVGLAPEH
jgi:succinyl-CoA synthetase beta subunit